MLADQPRGAPERADGGFKSLYRDPSCVLLPQHGKEYLLTIAYALLSVTFAAISAVFVWSTSGLLWAALTYVGVGTVVFLGVAFLVAMRDGASLRRSQPRKTGRSAPRADSVARGRSPGARGVDPRPSRAPTA